ELALGDSALGEQHLLGVGDHERLFVTHRRSLWHGGEDHTGSELGARILHPIAATAARPSATPAEPPGFLYVPDLTAPDEERALIGWFGGAPAWKEVIFRGQRARRRAMSFGARYLTQGRRLEPAPALPPELAAFRDRMVEAACAGLGREL